MSIDSLCAMLVTEPFNKSFDEIKRMTMRQIERILFHPRYSEGHPQAGAIMVPSSDDGEVTDKELFFEAKAREGFRPHEIEILYDEYSQVEGAKFAMRQKGTIIMQEDDKGKVIGSTRAGGYTDEEIETAGRELARRLRARRKFTLR